MNLRLFLQKMKGGETSPDRKPFSEIAWSWLGAFFGIYLAATAGSMVGADLLSRLFGGLIRSLRGIALRCATG